MYTIHVCLFIKHMKVLLISSDWIKTMKSELRSGLDKSNFYLLVKKKSDQTPWSKISPTHVEIDKNIKFDVGEISEEDAIIENKE